MDTPHINKINKIFAESPFNEFNLEINTRISFIVENQLSNNHIFVRLAKFNEDLSEIEAVFIGSLINHCVFPSGKNKYFDLADSNNFLMVLTIVDNVKKYYYNGNYPWFYNEEGYLYIKKIVDKMPLK